MKAWVDVVAERARQREVEGWTAEHDDQYKHNELVKAAVCYAKAPITGVELEDMWPWDMRWFKSTDRRRNLVKAAALLLAEIERLDRLEAK